MYIIVILASIWKGSGERFGRVLRSSEFRSQNRDNLPPSLPPAGSQRKGDDASNECADQLRVGVATVYGFMTVFWCCSQTDAPLLSTPACSRGDPYFKHMRVLPLLPPYLRSYEVTSLRSPSSVLPTDTQMKPDEGLKLNSYFHWLFQFATKQIASFLKYSNARLLTNPALIPFPFFPHMAYRISN